jgi:hypothetical protein
MHTDEGAWLLSAMHRSILAGYVGAESNLAVLSALGEVDGSAIMFLLSVYLIVGARAPSPSSCCRPAQSWS